MCYVCGKKNLKGLRLDFTHPEAGKLETSVVFSKEHQGFKGMVHGGVVAMILDEMMVNLAWVEKKPAVTAELNVRLKKALRVGERVFFEGRIEAKDKGDRLLYACASAKNEAGEIAALATATCMRIKGAKNVALEEKKK